MKTIKINFTDFFNGFDKENNYIINAIREKYDVVISENPDYLFYSCFGYNFLNYKCVRIFFSGEDVSPDFNLCDYAIAFDDIRFSDRYLRFPLCVMCESFDIAQKKHIFTEKELELKTKFCNFVYSNANANPIRSDFFQKLSEYKRVDSGGKYMNNIGHPVDNKKEFQEKYRFTIAFENDSVPDYSTEKIMDAFAAKTIPIYWGDINIAKRFNPKSFINCHDYASFDNVIKRVIEIDNDPELYKSILAEPIFKNGIVPAEFSNEQFKSFLYHIFDQPLDKAKRISPFTFKRYYEQKLSDTFEFNNRMKHLVTNKIINNAYTIYSKFIK